MSTRRASIAILLVCGTSTWLAGQAGPTTTTEGAKLMTTMQSCARDQRTAQGTPTDESTLVGFVTAPATLDAEAKAARTCLQALDGLHTDQLSHDEWVSYGIEHYDMEMAAENDATFAWLPTVVTPYASPLRNIPTIFQTAPLKTAHDRDRYLALLHALPAALKAYSTHLTAQEDHGVALPADEIALVVPFVRSFAVAPPASPLSVAAARLSAFPPNEQTTFAAEVDDFIRTTVNPAYDELAAFIDGPYRTKAHGLTAVGQAQYPNGPAYYQHLIHLHTGLTLTPQQIHDMGLKEVARINGELDTIRQSVAFAGTLDDFKTYLRTDRRFYPQSASEIGERMMTAIHLIEPKMSAFFSEMPKAPYGVRRLAPELEPSMTYGYYSVPTATDPEGYYNYNGLHPEERSMTMVSAIIFHELLPGHHYQLSLRAENPRLTGLRKTAMYTAYTEGWGEYASDLANDMGGYPDPYARAGRLGMDLFVSSRLVVDTGMNALGWSRERAIAFMKANTFESDAELATETLRYSVDYPGQALAYKLGSLKIHEERDRLKAARGAAFDIREFHRYLLDAGEMPLGMLDQHFTCLINGEAHHK